jgi:hypothetical protein
LDKPGGSRKADFIIRKYLFGIIGVGVKLNLGGTGFVIPFLTFLRLCNT